jgi:hypothetical protein
VLNPAKNAAAWSPSFSSRVASHLTGSLPAWTSLLLTVAVGPLFFFRYPGLQDYPNHLARGFILLNPSDPILNAIYRVHWAALPNLGWDLWVMLAGRVLSLEWVGKLYLMISMSSILLGCFALSGAAQSRSTFAPLFATPLLYNAGLSMGFLSFELGAGCALFAIAWWVRSKNDPWPRRILLGTFWSTALFFIHFYAWSFYGLFILCYEIQLIYLARRNSSVRGRVVRLLRDGLQAVPVLAVLIYTSVTRADASANTESVLRSFAPPYVRIGEIQNLVDVGIPVVNIILVIAMATLVFVLFRRRWLTFNLEFAAPISVSMLLFFILPDQIADTYYVSWRILFMATLVAISSCYFTEEGEKRIGLIMSVVAMVTLVIAATHVWSWRNSELGRESFSKVMRNVPDGSALFIAHSGMRPRQMVSRAIGLYHVGSFAVLTKKALVQSMFVIPGQQPLEFRDPFFQRRPKESATFLSEIKATFRKSGLDFHDFLYRFDYVVIHGPDSGDDLQALTATDLVAVDTVEDFRLYKVPAQTTSFVDPCKSKGQRRAGEPLVFNFRRVVKNRLNAIGNPVNAITFDRHIADLFGASVDVALQNPEPALKIAQNTLCAYGSIDSIWD